MSVQGQKGLFAAAPYLSDAARYPRGYSPGRMAEVRGALMRTRAFDGIEMTRPTVAEPEMDGYLSSAGRHTVAALHRRGVHEAIARSTVPASELKTVGSIRTNDALLDTKGASGLYQPSSKTVTIRKMRAPDSRGLGGSSTKVDRQIISSEEQHSADVLIHELGHHHDRTVTGTHPVGLEHPDVVSTRGGSVVDGRAEAAADDFMVTHRRQDPKDRALNKAKPPETYLSKGAITGAQKPYVSARQNLMPHENTLAMSDSEFIAHQVASREQPPRQRMLPGHSAKERLQTLQAGGSYLMPGNHLNGRQFGGTPAP